MIGIRREDKNMWERRAPLTPPQVAELIARHGIGVAVQPSPHRVFQDHEYVAAGARLDEHLTGCSVVLGIKEIPPAKIEPGRAYVFFSHTTKGQRQNMPMLRRLLELGCTLIDYEQIKDATGRRLIFFGRHAGHAGMVDGLWAWGTRLALEGHETPLAALRPAHAYADLDAVRRDVARVGDELRARGLPAGAPPLVCGITGTGNVASGAFEVLDELQPITLTPAELARAAAAGTIDRSRAYKVVIDLEPRYRKRGGGSVTLDELTAHPERFENGMLEHLPRISLLVNGMFWTPALPRLLSLADLSAGWPLGWLRVIADISCDIDGAIEATVRATTPAEPVFVFDVRERRARDGYEGDGPVILAVDNLPAELPRESSADFGTALLPLAPALARCDFGRDLAALELPHELGRATIAHRGRLAPAFAYLERDLARGVP